MGLDDLLRDVRYGLRGLTIRRTYAGVATLTIAVAVAASAVGFAVLRTVLEPLPYGHAERLVALVEADSRTPDPQMAAYATVRDWTARAQSFEAVATWGDTAIRLVRSDGVELVRGMEVSSNFFDTLGVPMARGRTFRLGEDRRGADRVLVLTHETWVALFAADPEIVGRSVSTITGPYLVVGVLPEDFHPLHMSNPAEFPRVFVPYDSSQAMCRTSGCRRAGVVARLKPGISAGHAAAEIQAITHSLIREYADQYPQDEFAVVTPLREHVVGRFESAVWMVEVGVVLLIMLACANVGTLLVARTLSRQAEFAVRAALGATRWDLVRQLSVEGLLLALAGTVVGGALSWWTTQAIARSSTANVPRIGELSPDLSMLGFASVVSLVVAAIAGLPPAVAALQQSFTTMREASGITPRSHQRTVRMLVGVELALAFVLVALVGLFGKSYLLLLSVNPGFEAKGVTTLSLLPDAVHYQNDDERQAWFDAVAARMRVIPGVEDAAYASTLPLSHPSRFPIMIRERPLTNNAAPVVDAYLVSPNYTRVMRIALRAGRDFMRSDNRNGEPVALVSASAERLYFGGQSAIGQHVHIGARADRVWARVVGITGDVHQSGLDVAADPAVYLLFDQVRPAPQGWASLVVRSRQSDNIEAAMRTAMRDVDPLQPIFHVQPMTTYIALSVAQRALMLALIATLGATAMALAMIGVYGVVSYTVERRTREVGLRMAIGASVWSVRRLIAAQILSVALVAIACGAGIAAVIGEAAASLLFEVRPLDGAVLTVVGGLIIASTLTASAVPAWRASRVDPMKTLRAD